ncbi:hypothetical protein MUO65_00295 [bacterium]|nr:hypothetical protein [bacterium]
MKLQLLVQAVLWALSNGIKLGGAEPSSPVPLALALALPISLVFTGLYFVEDGLIHRLSQYVGSLSEFEKKLSKGDIKIICWDASEPLRGYAKGITLILRQVAQIAGFLILPGYLALSYHQESVFEPWQIWIQIIVFFFIAGLIIAGYIQRRKTGKEFNNKVLKKEAAKTAS